MFNNIIKNIIKLRKVLAIILVFFILFFMLINSIMYKKTSFISDKVFGFFSGISKLVFDIKMNLYPNYEQDDIEILKKENSKLRNELIEAKVTKSEIQELEQLKKALNFVNDDSASDFISSDIIAKNDGNYYNSFTLSAGSKDGVKLDSIVVNSDGLIGRIYQVSDRYCKAMSILDKRFSVSFMRVDENEDTGILNQDIRIREIQDDFLIKGYMFDSNSQIEVGEIITTSGLGLYPKSIPIGTVSQIIPDEQNLLKYIVVKPFVDFKKLDKVIIFNKKEI